ncbi:head maturation protease, ClpP-related [Arthrobacter sp. NPDC090010]|uniref:head maturation protease, ClpP-related n=1 Tax=Arthrobacter sp. NPDC090010 TaxID=3363942 RepID=UPI00381D1730
MFRTRHAINAKTDGSQKKWFRMESTPANDSADVYIYDAIGGWFGVEASWFVQDLNDLDVSTINLYVNSPGGDVYDGLAIMNALSRHKAKVVATVDGLAASAASYIIQAADEIVMGHGAELMIHDAWSGGVGDAEFLRSIADDLDRLSQTIAGIYAQRTGGETTTWREAMHAETWYSAEEAVSAGLADRVAQLPQRGGDTTSGNSFDMKVFAHAGRAAAPAPYIPPGAHRRGGLDLAIGGTAQDVSAGTEPVTAHTPQEGATDMASDAFMKGLRERLGIPADSELSEDQILEAVDEALEEVEEETETSTPVTAPAEGTVVVDEDSYRELQAQAREGREARQEQLTTRREAAVDAAVQDGRIAPARREHWLNTIAADPGMEQVLNGLEKGLVVPLEPNGYTGGVDEAADESTYNRIFPKTKEA